LRLGATSRGPRSHPSWLRRRLKNYRIWVYLHIPPSKLQEKRRNYFSPEEIAAIEKKLLEQPDFFAYWSEHVPMNLQAIQNGRK